MNVSSSSGFEVAEFGTKLFWALVVAPAVIFVGVIGYFDEVREWLKIKRDSIVDFFSYWVRGSLRRVPLIKKLFHDHAAHFDGDIEVIFGGDRVIERDNLKLSIVTSPKIPKSMRDAIAEQDAFIESEQVAGNKLIFNGKQFSIKSIVRDLTQGDKKASLCVDFYRTRYAYFLATIKKLVVARRDHKLASVARQFGFTPGDPTLNPLLAHGVGLVVAMATRDNKLVSGIRSKHCEIRPGAFDLAIAEGLDDEDEGSNGIDLWEAAARAVREEAGIEVDPDHFKLVGLAVDTCNHQHNFIFLCKLNVTSRALTAMRNDGCTGHWEIQLRYFPMTVRGVQHALRRGSSWAFSVVAVKLLCRFYYKAIFRKLYRH